MATWNEHVSSWRPVRRNRRTEPMAGRQWPPQDLLILVVAFALRWELGLAFLGLKLWQQASGTKGSVVSFARDKWDGLVEAARRLGSSTTMASFGTQSSGNRAFDQWRQNELDRIEAERARLKEAEREFAAYREHLLHARDHEEFSEFMRRDTDRPDVARPRQ